MRPLNQLSAEGSVFVDLDGNEKLFWIFFFLAIFDSYKFAEVKKILLRYNLFSTLCLMRIDIKLMKKLNFSYKLQMKFLSVTEGRFKQFFAGMLTGTTDRHHQQEK